MVSRYKFCLANSVHDSEVSRIISRVSQLLKDIGAYDLVYDCGREIRFFSGNTQHYVIRGLEPALPSHLFYVSKVYEEERSDMSKFIEAAKHRLKQAHSADALNALLKEVDEHNKSVQQYTEDIKRRLAWIKSTGSAEFDEKVYVVYLAMEEVRKSKSKKDSADAARAVVTAIKQFN